MHYFSTVWCLFRISRCNTVGQWWKHFPGVLLSLCLVTGHLHAVLGLPSSSLRISTLPGVSCCRHPVSPVNNQTFPHLRFYIFPFYSPHRFTYQLLVWSDYDNMPKRDLVESISSTTYRKCSTTNDIYHYYIIKMISLLQKLIMQYFKKCFSYFSCPHQ